MSDLKELRVSPYENARKIMYLAKEILKSSEKINISATTNSAGIAARAAETLRRLGYITYDNVQTETIIENDRKRIKFVITVKKTNDFEKIYNENEEMKKKKDEERKAKEEKV